MNTNPESDIKFNDIFEIEELQRLQDLFADANGVASIITDPSGTPITKASNFTFFCEHIIRSTEKGNTRCALSDSALNNLNSKKPLVLKCLSAGLWDASAPIIVGEVHIANWLIGQVRNEELNLEAMLQYADEIGANKEDFKKALYDVPIMSSDKFKKIAEMLYAFANELSEKAYKNIQLKKEITERQNAEVALHENEQRSHLILESANEAIMIAQDGFFKYFNPVLCELTGYDENELMSMHFINLIHPDSKELILENYRKRVNNEPVDQRYQIKLLTKDGIEKWIELSGSRFEWEGRSATLNFAIDITQRKLAEQAYIESEEKYSKVFQTAPYGMMLIDMSNEKIVEVNYAFCAIMDYSKEEIREDESIGTKIWCTQYDKKNIITHLFEERVVLDWELLFSKKDGQLIIGSVSAQKVSIQNMPYAILSINDITKRKNYEEQIRTKNEELDFLNSRLSAALENIKIANFGLRDANEELAAKSTILSSEKIFSETLFESIPGFFYVYNEDNKLIKWNKNHEIMTGYSGEELSNMTLDDWYDSDELSRVKEAFARVVTFGSGEVEAQMNKKDGSKIFVHVKGVKLVIDNHIYILGVGTNISTSKNTERKLYETEERYKSIITASSDDICITNLQGIIQTVSPIAIQMFGYEREDEIIGRQFTDFIAPEDIELGLTNMQRLLHGETLGTVEYKVLRKDGTVFYVETNAELIRNTNGEPTEIIFVIRNIIERKNAEEALLKSEERYRGLIKNLDAGIVVHAADSAIILNNERANELLELSNEQLRGKLAIDPCWKFVDTNGNPMEIKDYPINRVINSKSPIKDLILGLVTNSAENNIRWLTVNGVPIFDRFGEISEVIISFIDITERKQTEEAILNAIAFQQVLLDAIPAPVFYKDTNGLYIGGNKAFESYSGLTQDQFIGKSVFEISPPDTAEIFHKYDQELLDNSGFQTYEASISFADGRVHDVIFNKATFENANNKLAGIIGIIQDISERKFMENAILRTSRLYALNSQINQAIVRSKNPNELYNSICQVAIDYGHFRMAWIGLADENKLIKPAAIAGHEDGYLSKTAITTDDTIYGEGITGRAFKSGAVVTSIEIDSDPEMQPWKDAALERGYLSAASVSFSCKGVSIGTLTLYSSEIGFFTIEEQRLLQEVGDEISFSLNTMAKEEDRLEIEEVLKINNTQLQLAMQAANMAWWEMNIENGSILFDDRRALMLGYLPDKFHYYKDFMALVHPDDAEPIMENMQDHLKGDSDKYEVEYRILASNGTYKWFYDIGSVISRDKDGNALKITGLIIDISERKRAEIALFQSEEMLRESQIIAGLGGYILDFNTGTWKATEALEQIMGISSFSGRTVQDWLDITHPDDRDRMGNYFTHEVVEKRSRFDNTYRIMRASDKSVRWVHGLGQLVFDAYGNLLKMRGTIQDITEQKIAEDAIKEREQRYTSIFEHNQAVMLIIDPTTAKIIDVNEATCNYYGYSYQQLTNMYLSDLNTMSREVVQARLRQAAKKEKNHFFLQHRLASSEIRDVEVYSGPINLGGNDLVYSIVHDITERREAETKILETSSLLKSILESSPEIVVFALDKEYRYLTFNSKHKEVIKHIWGKEIEVGMSMLEVIGNHSDREVAKANFDRALAGESFVITEEYGNETLARLTWLDYWSPIYNGAGKISGLTCFVLNITERKQAEAIRAQNKELTESIADKDRFMSILAHDLRSPFNSILGYLQNLSSNLHKYDIDQIEMQVNTIYASAKRSYKLLEDILMWARAQSGKLTYEPEKWNLANIINEVADELKGNAANKTITINRFKPAKELNVLTDINMLKTILRNLISNAIKFTYYGGKIDVDAHITDDFITVSVADTGVGMSTITLNKLFDFTQNLTTLGTAKEKGTGLGLLLCKEFIDKHGGSIWAESSIGQGSTFFFTIPAYQDPQLEHLDSDEFEPDAHSDLPKDLNILIVEENELSHESAKAIFQPYSNSITFANSGIQTIDICRKNNQLNMILLDMHLPDMTGYETVRQIRQFNKEVIIVAQTAFAVSGVREKAILAGCNDYFPKPYKKTLLSDLMKKLFPAKKVK